MEHTEFSLGADEMILFMEDPKASTQKVLEPMSRFSRVVGYRINVRKSIAFCFVLFLFLRAAFAAYGSSQARGRMGPGATSLCPSQSYMGSEPHL